ncbi:MAG: mechanosensitive ion channel protein [Gracilibacter sp. BRH_c7a]|nr:MAG: mechanosensitive ion channel protein [Gracilibacter sp. BRH_c7a]
MSIEWLKDWVNSIEIWQDIGIALGIFFVFLVFRKIFTNYVYKIILRLTKKIPLDIFTNIFLAYEKPLRFLFVVIGIFVALLYLPLHDYYIVKSFRTIVIILIGWGLYNLASIRSNIFSTMTERLNIEVDEILLPFVSKLIRFSIVIVTISIIAGEWEYNVGGFLAGLGLGGLAFALAAKDSLSNFFGGIVIITEKPFSIGDWIKTPSVEGVVEDISFRSTRVRTFAQALVTVPNATLANEAIINWTKMGKRQISFNLGVMYSTPKEKIKTCVERIDRMLREHEEIDQELIMVRFNEFNDSSLDLFLYFFTKTTSWVEYLQVKEDINLKIMDILEQENVSVAFPSRTIYMENSGEGYRNLSKDIV